MITTESSNANALRMAKFLIQNKLAACVSIKQIFSIYKWDDDIEENKEFEITIKSKPEFKDNLIDFLNKRFNNNAITWAITKKPQSWSMNKNFLSRSSTTDIDQIPTIVK